MIDDGKAGGGEAVERGKPGSFDPVSGEVHGSGSGAGGAGSPAEDYDSDPAAGGGAASSASARPVGKDAHHGPVGRE